MDNRNQLRKAVILVNPLGGICEFRDYARERNYIIVSVYTVQKDILRQRMGQDVNNLIRMDDHSIFSSDLQKVQFELGELPFEYCAVIPSHECGVEFVADLAEALKLVHNKPEDMRVARDKRLMRERVSDAGLVSPRFAKISSEEDIENFLDSHGYPVVIKTPLGGGTSNVFVCKNREETIKGYEKIRTSQDLFGNKSNSAVLESYLGGREMIVDGFVDGEKITIVGVWEYDKISTEYGDNLYYNILSRDICDPKYRVPVEYTKKVAEVVGIRYGMFHCELKWLNDSPALIEIGSRLPGWGIPELYRASSNFDPWDRTLEVFSKGRLDSPINFKSVKHMAMALCPIEVEGRIERIEGVKEIKSLLSYERHIIKIKEGEWISPTSELYDTPIEVCLAHEDKDQLMSDVEAVHALFKVHTSTFPESEPLEDNNRTFNIKNPDFSYAS